MERLRESWNSSSSGWVKQWIKLWTRSLMMMSSASSRGCRVPSRGRSLSTGIRMSREKIFDHPVIRDLQGQVASLQAQLQTARTEVAALRVARDAAISVERVGRPARRDREPP